ncbi:MAG TPA: Wzz/FepE/Etk N-terminal domain-containing protein, partial [Bacteroidales bacterium]|nr:Wzz/FepE/Etk N-terminal domain-containing protein [Bacteroidales bacterium]
MSYATNSNEEENINIQKYFFLFVKNWFWFTTAIIISFVIVFLVNRYSSPVYEANNTVIITEKEAAMGAMGTIMKEFGSLSGKSQNIENYIGILQSYTLVKQTLERLDYRVSYFHKGRINNVEVFNRCPIRIELDTS